MPAGLIDQKYGVCAGRDGGGDLHQVQVHRLGVVERVSISRSDRYYRGSGLAQSFSEVGRHVIG